MPMFKELNPYIKLDGSPFYINREVEEWDKMDNAPRRAGVSSFGFGGAYAHVVLEEYANQIQRPDSETFISSHSIRLLDDKKIVALAPSINSVRKCNKSDVVGNIFLQGNWCKYD